MPSTHVTLSTRLYYCLGTTLYCVPAKHRVGMFKTYFVCSEHTRVWIVSNCFWRSAALSLRRVSEHVGCAPEHGSCLLNIPITVGTPACNTEARMDHYCTGMGHWGGNSEISKKLQRAEILAMDKHFLNFCWDDKNLIQTGYSRSSVHWLRLQLNHNFKFFN